MRALIFTYKYLNDAYDNSNNILEYLSEDSLYKLKELESDRNRIRVPIHLNTFLDVICSDLEHKGKEIIDIQIDIDSHTVVIKYR